MPLNRSLLFFRAWNNYRTKTKHLTVTTFSKELSACYHVAKIVGYDNYKLVSKAEIDQYNALKTKHNAN